MAGGVRAEQVLTAELWGVGVAVAVLVCTRMLQKGSFLSVRNLLLNLEAESQGQSPRDLVQVAAHQRWCLLQDSMWERGSASSLRLFPKGAYHSWRCAPNYDLGPPTPKLYFVLCWAWDPGFSLHPKAGHVPRESAFGYKSCNVAEGLGERQENASGHRCP